MHVYCCIGNTLGNWLYPNELLSSSPQSLGTANSNNNNSNNNNNNNSNAGICTNPSEGTQCMNGMSDVQTEICDETTLLN